MDKKTTDIVGYIGWIGFLIAFLAGTKEESKFHLNQALLLNLFGLIPVLNFVCFVFMIIQIIAASNGEEKEVPVIGGIRLLQ